MCRTCRCLGPLHGPEFHLIKRRDLQPQSIECVSIGYPDESKGFKMVDIKTKQIIIERSVKFDEPLQEVERVKEKTAEMSFTADRILLLHRIL